MPATLTIRTNTVENQTLSLLGSSGVDLSSLSQCLAGTRCDVVGGIQDWALNPSPGDDSNVLWVYGVAGIGKSAVAATVATRFSDMGRLGAFIAFDRASQAQIEPSTAVSALARQLAEYDGRLRASIIQTINDRTKAPVLRASLSDKFDRLIVKTFASVPGLSCEGPIAIVLDGLYDCGQRNDWASLLELLVCQTKNLPSNLRFIITSRTVNGICKASTGTLLHPRIKTLELRSSSLSDLSAYFTFRMRRIRLQKDLQEDWPGQAAIEELTTRAFGFFAWAVDASNFVDAYCPLDRLESLLLQPFGSISEPNSTLDKLYTAALNSAGDWADDGFVKKFRAIMDAIIKSPISISTTALDRPILQCLGSVLTHEPTVRVLHPSFLYFLSSRERCQHGGWHFEEGPLRVSGGSAIPCLQRMKAGLKRNICDMTLSARDLSTIEVLPEELIYACRSWVDHVCTGKRFESWEMEVLAVFLHTHLLHWFEIMSVFKKSEDIVPMLRRLAKWFEVNLTIINISNYLTLCSGEYLSTLR